MELTVSLETVCRLIARARELEVEAPIDESEEDDDAADGEDPFGAIDDDANSALEDEVRVLLEDLADDEVTEVLALALIGRGTYDPSEWDEAIEETDGDPDDAIDQLLDMPLLAAYLDAGLAAFDLRCDGIGQID